MAKQEQQEEGFKYRTPVNTRLRDKVAIVGFTDHRHGAFQLNRNEWEIWGLNELHKAHDWQLFDRWFEVHKRKDLDTDKDHIGALAKMDLPVYMQDHYPDIPASIPFPKDEILSVFGIDYFTSSIGWEVALAIIMGFKEIHVYGVDMAQESEYAKERPSLEFWLGVARGMGVTVSVPATSDLLKTVGQYGFGELGDAFSLKLKERKAWLHQQDNDILAQIRSLETQYVQIKGKIDGEYHAATEKMEAEYHNKRDGLHSVRNQMVGAIADVEYWERSYSQPSSLDRTFSPDRSQDPRTGIQPASDGKPEVDALGVNPKNRLPAEVAARA